MSPSLTIVRCLHQSARKLTADLRHTLAIRREDASIWERRAPLAPHHVEKLTKMGVRILVQPSNRRAYPLQSYVRAGAEAREDISEAAVILGVKQVPIDQLLPNKTYCFFSHTIKAQEANMPLLDAVLDKNVRLVDYECLKDSSGERLVAFGKFAGYAGMTDILHGMGLRLLALGHHTPFMHIGPAHNYRNVGTAKQAVRDAGYEIALGKMPRSIGPLTFVFTGTGNVSQGAQEVFAELPIEYVDQRDLQDVAEKGSTSKIYGTVVTRSDHLRRKSGNSSLSSPQSAAAAPHFDAQDYMQNPQDYYSTFSTKIAPYSSVIINGVFWEQKFPRLLTIPDAKKLQTTPVKSPLLSAQLQQQLKSIGSPSLPHRLLAICDISADPSGSIEFMSRCSVIDKPFYLYDAEQNSTEEDLAGDGFLICSIDNMPTQLPLESTDMFGNLLLPYMPEIMRSDANKSVEEENFSSVVGGAIIASNGKLQPNYEKIQEERKKRDHGKRHRPPRDGGVATKEVLLLGAGHVSAPLVSHLCADPNVQLTVVSHLETELKRLEKFASQHGNMRPVIMDVGQKKGAVSALIGQSDLVVSLLPYSMHPVVAKMCIENKVNMLTASYLSKDMKELDSEAKQAGITVMNEVGLDPGIDHLLAKRVIDQVATIGGRVTSFKSYCCGLPTPEFADNALGYKFGWNPRGAFAITMNGAQWKSEGEVLVAEPGHLMECAQDVDFLKGFALEAFPNRDSLEYLNLYNLPDAETCIRGTMRYRGFSEAILALRSLGLMDTSPNALFDPQDGRELSWRQCLAELLGHSSDVSPSTIKSLVYDKVGRSETRLNAIVDLGLLEDEPVDKLGTPFDSVRDCIIRRLKFRGDENDLVIMRVIFGIEWADKTHEQKQLSLVVYGDCDTGGFSAMAKTVGYPTAIAAKMLLNGEIQNKGMVMPLQPEIYHPILKRLASLGIFAREH